MNFQPRAADAARQGLREFAIGNERLENEKEAGQVFPPPSFPFRGIRLT